MMRDLHTMTDAELDRRAAEARGFEKVHDAGNGRWVGWRNGVEYEIPHPTTDANDAIELAEWWRGQASVDASYELSSPEPPMFPDWSAEIGDGFARGQASAPARALTIAVLQAIQQEVK